jgi:hypothetical protein
MGSIDSDQIKTNVVTHADEENTPADDVLNQKIAETTSNATVFIRLSSRELIVRIYWILGTKTFIIGT